jgi:hypothetical protein
LKTKATSSLPQLPRNAEDQERFNKDLLNYLNRFNRDVHADLEGVSGTTADFPIGTIIPWHKDIATIALPDGWLECNGQTVNDSDSPLNGETLPDLNNPKESWNAYGAFLRGALNSGVWGDDQFQGFKMDTSYGSGFNRRNLTGNSYNAQTMWFGSYGKIYADTFVNDGTNGDPRTGAETTPVYMTVVWIIKVKDTSYQALTDATSHITGGLTVDNNINAGGNISADGEVSAGSLSVDGVDWDFTNDKSGNGYQKLPNGLIIQWGYSSGHPTFPIEFPNACLRVVPQIYYASSHAFAGGYVAVTGMSTTRFTRTHTTINCYYIAIGH